MPILSNQNKQKSLKRRFLLILGAIAFTSLLVLGGMFIFWDKIPIDLTTIQKRLFGAFIIVYAVIRFQRLIRKDPNEEEED